MEAYIQGFSCLLILTTLTGCIANGAIDEWRTYAQSPEERAYHLFVPENILENEELVPLVINMHGATPSPPATKTFGSAFQKIITGMPVHSANNGYIVVHPQARNIGGTQYWVTSDNLDVDFINGIVEALSNELPIDPRRIYLTGFSSGGILSWKLACEYSDRYAAIAPVAADRRAATECPNARSVPVLSFHGTADSTVGFEGGINSVTSWAEEHQCQTKEIVFSEKDSTCERWSNCDDGSEMQFCSSQEAGHTWPSGPGSFVISAAGYGRTSYTLDATDLIWKFFANVALPDAIH
ncbi:MAG: hypothetical protein MI867_01980 [Pseudomonadales bacterium]|nr:hypothetical protein [Pseudomonadales bacterium]